MVETVKDVVVTVKDVVVTVKDGVVTVEDMVVKDVVAVSYTHLTLPTTPYV